jgi:hypothetical protein
VNKLESRLDLQNLKIMHYPSNTIEYLLCLCRKDGKKDQDSRSAPEPKKPEENPASVSAMCLSS